MANILFLQRIRTIPEIDGLSKDTVMTSWLAKYDAITKGRDNPPPSSCTVHYGRTFFTSGIQYILSMQTYTGSTGVMK